RASLVVVVQFQQQAPAIRLERPVGRTGRTAGVRARTELLAAAAVFVAADDEVAGDHVHFLPVFVNERHCGVDAWLESQMPCAKALSVLLVERTSQHLLFHARRPARRHLPTRITTARPN